MPTRDETAERIHDATVSVLRSDIKVLVKPDATGHQNAFDVAVTVGKTTHRFLAGWAGRGYLPNVEQLLKAVSRVEVVYARALSEEALDLIKHRRLGWVDETGHAEVVVPSTGLFVRVVPKPVSSGPSSNGGWTRSMLAIAEAALAGESPTVRSMEKATGLSRGAAANSLGRLEKLGLLGRSSDKPFGPESERRVVDREKLLDEYARWAGVFRAKQKVLHLHRLWRDPLSDLAHQVAPALSGRRWGVTGAAASLLLAPYLTNVTTIELYVEHDLLIGSNAVTDLLRAKDVARGHNIEVREFPTLMSSRGPTVDGVQVALPTRVYADLVAAGGRFTEAAQHLRESPWLTR